MLYMYVSIGDALLADALSLCLALLERMLVLELGAHDDACFGGR